MLQFVDFVESVPKWKYLVLLEITLYAIKWSIAALKITRWLQDDKIPISNRM